MMKKLTTLALCMVAFSAQSEGSSFKGFHAGIHGGWAQAKAQVSKSSADIGIHAGYDWAMGNTVIGVETYLDYNSFSIKSQINSGTGGHTIGTTPTTAVPANTNYDVEIKAPLHFGFSTRLGYDVSGFLVYTSVGINMTKLTETEKYLAASHSVPHFAKTLPVGLGVEKAFNNIRAGVFFNHHFKVGNKSFSGNQAGVRLSYKF